MSERSWESRGWSIDALAEIDRAEALGWAAIAGALIWAAFSYRAAYSGHFAVVHDPAFPQWWDWSDQGRYYRAAQAWAQGSLDPSQHWYSAGYPLLGATLFRLAPGHPFYLVDLACLLLVGLLLSLVAGRLSTTPIIGRVLGAAVFVGTVVLTPYAMKSFVEPWTTTPTAPLTLAALLLAFRLWDRPTSRYAFALGLATTSIAMFRPIDIAPLALSIGIFTAAKLRSLRAAAAATAGASLPLLAAVLTHVSVFGLQQSPYLQQSALTGFEWRLIPLHWVTLFVSPRPEFPDEFSLSQTFPWVIPGMVGMVACLIASSGVARLRHGLVIATLLLHCLLYLAYRDLHPQGLFRFGQYHYFKWCLPVFGLYAGFLLTEILRHRRFLSCAAGLAAAALLFSWRMVWQDVPAPWLADAGRQGDHTLLMPQPPRSVYDGLFVPAAGGLSQIYLSSYEMRVGDRVFAANADFKALPTEGGLVFTVLRPMPPGATSIAFDHQIELLPGQLRLLRAHLFWRWPHLEKVVDAYYSRWLGAG